MGIRKNKNRGFQKLIIWNDAIDLYDAFGGFAVSGDQEINTPTLLYSNTPQGKGEK